MIMLTNSGQKILIDDDDFEKLSVCVWSVNYKGYARSEIKYKAVTMHRLIMGVTDPKVQVDHINGNRLDNRKENLRLCTNQQNQFNREKNKNNTSGFKGVKLRTDRKKWVANININGKRIYLGMFDCPKKASVAYKKAAKKFHGEFYRV